MIKCSAPGKICLFGEHGVVYGKHSIACSIDLRAHVSIKEIYATKSYVKSNNQKYNINQHPYILSVFEEMNKLIDLKNFSIVIDSQIPIKSGLGSSSAIVIALIQCLNLYYKSNLSFEEIANIGYFVEKKVQGLASPMDTYVSTFGGTIKFPEKKKISFFNHEIIVANSMEYASTKNMLNKVRILKNKYPLIIDQILNTMDLISIEGELSILSSNIKQIGDLMNLNQGLLDSIGVNSKSLSSLIYEFRKYGVFGSKITGSGGGGCIISLCTHSKVKNILNAIKNKGCCVFICSTTKHGVKQESNNKKI